MTAQKPSCVVLGGGGFIGTNLCRRLVSLGYRVRSFSRRFNFPRGPLDAERYHGDITDLMAVTSAIKSFDIVFHLAQCIMPSSATLGNEEDPKRHVGLTVALLDICRKLEVEHVVFISSGGTIYGPAQQIPTPETAPVKPITAYGRSNLIIEESLSLYEQLFGLQYCVLRVSNAFGPFQIGLNKQGIIAALISNGMQGKPAEIWGDGSVVRDFVFIDDVVDAVIAAARQRSGSRFFNIGSGEGRSLRDIIASVERLLNRKLEIDWRPGRWFDVPVSILAIDRAREILRWLPKTEFETGLRQTVAWWQTEDAPMWQRGDSGMMQS
jgi:UDP-glucose 4-epimerase